MTALSRRKKALAEHLSLVDAAASVLRMAHTPLRLPEIVERARQRGWSPRDGGKTPHQTLATAVVREMAHRGQRARFKRVARGLYTVRGKACIRSHRAAE